MMRRVLKFGGTSLSTPGLIGSAAASVARLAARGEQVAVVVSAGANSTSELLAEMVKVAGGNVGYSQMSEFLALGEERSAFLMAEALNAHGCKSQVFTPRRSETWPLIADIEDQSPLSAAKINEERAFSIRKKVTASRFSRFVLPAMRVGTVPVITGFVALDSYEKIFALGRGGSDISAFIAAAYTGADEVVIVTDVEGILSADPRLVNNAELQEELTFTQLKHIADAGARIIHPRALQFKPDYQQIRILDYRKVENLETSGTKAQGRREQQNLVVRNSSVSRISVMLKANANSQQLSFLGSLLDQLGDAVISSSISRTAIYLYSRDEHAPDLYQRIDNLIKAEREHSKVVLNVGMLTGLAEVECRYEEEGNPAAGFADLIGAFAKYNVAIVDVLTATGTITFYVKPAHLHDALKHVKEMGIG